MPSLKALKEFKASFVRLGSETQVLTELKLPFDDLALPDHEPAPLPEPVSEPDLADDELIGDDLTDISSLQDDADTAGEEDFFSNMSDLFSVDDTEPVEDEEPGLESLADFEEAADAQPATDLEPATDFEPATDLESATGFESLTDLEPPADILPTEDLPQDDFIEDFTEDFIEDFTPPDDLLEEFTEELETPAEIESAPPEDSADIEETTETFDFGDLESSFEEPESPIEDIETPMESFGESEDLGDMGLSDFEPSEEPVDFTDTDFGEAPTDFTDTEFGEELADFADTELGEEPADSTDTEDTAFEDFTPPDFSQDDTNLDDYNISDEPLESEAVVSQPIVGDDSQDFDEEFQNFNTEAFLEEIPGDTFDSFDPDYASTEFGLGDNFDKVEDFPIPGMDFDESVLAPEEAGAGAEIDEINLTSDELEKFLTTLSSYPLNLRVACQELIAEQAVAPDKMSKLVALLVGGASAVETAELAGRLLDRTITIHRDFQKLSGEALEAEQASFAYIFVHNFLPVLKMFMLFGALVFSIAYLCWQFIYKPIRADRIYKMGIERIEAGEYSRANERFWEAFGIHERQIWFFTYARAFRDARQYTLAEEKYLELFTYSATKSRRGIPDKTAVLEYAELLTYYIGNYELADWVIRRNILDHNPWDREALLAVGDINLIWGDYDPSRLEYARQAFAIYMERFGSSDPLLERMLKYFIRIDDLEQVLLLQPHFMEFGNPISASTLTELGGYFLDKRIESLYGVPEGNFGPGGPRRQVPHEFLGNITGIRDILVRSVQQDPMLPETYYHLARYYELYGNYDDERSSLELALRVFDFVREETPRRIRYNILALRRYADLLIQRREFFPAEEQLEKGITLYQTALARRLANQSPEFGRLYADMGDLAFFTRDGNMQNALYYYNLSEQHGWAPPEVHYRMGAAHYQLRQWGPALERLTEAHHIVPLNHRVLYALGNVSFMRGNYFAAQGYYDKLLEILDADRELFPVITPTDDVSMLDYTERLMIARNNLGVTLEALTERTGDNIYRVRAQGYFSDSLRAWDIVTRSPITMFRMRPGMDINAPGVNPAFLNIQNSLNPVPGFNHHFFLRIDSDIFEQSRWEELAPPGFSLSEGIHTGR